MVTGCLPVFGTRLLRLESEGPLSFVLHFFTASKQGEYMIGSLGITSEFGFQYIGKEERLENREQNKELQQDNLP
jgi:hypothetical protein